MPATVLADPTEPQPEGITCAFVGDGEWSLAAQRLVPIIVFTPASPAASRWRPSRATLRDGLAERRVAPREDSQ